MMSKSSECIPAACTRIWFSKFIGILKWIIWIVWTIRIAWTIWIIIGKDNNKTPLSSEHEFGSPNSFDTSNEWYERILFSFLFSPEHELGSPHSFHISNEFISHLKRIHFTPQMNAWIGFSTLIWHLKWIHLTPQNNDINNTFIAWAWIRFSKFIWHLKRMKWKNILKWNNILFSSPEHELGCPKSFDSSFGRRRLVLLTKPLLTKPLLTNPKSFDSSFGRRRLVLLTKPLLTEPLLTNPKSFDSSFGRWRRFSLKASLED